MLPNIKKEEEAQRQHAPKGSLKIPALDRLGQASPPESSSFQGLAGVGEKLSLHGGSFRVSQAFPPRGNFSATRRAWRCGPGDSGSSSYFRGGYRLAGESFEISLWPQMHWGMSGGQTQSVLSNLKNCLTMRSIERMEGDDRRYGRRGLEDGNGVLRPFSSTCNSRLTSMRNGPWKRRVAGCFSPGFLPLWMTLWARADNSLVVSKCFFSRAFTMARAKARALGSSPYWK